MIEQTFITVTGVVSIYLANDPNDSARRWAPIFGLAGQPAWLYSSYHAGQWGIFMLSIVYTIVWARGFQHHWLRQGA